MTVLVFVFVHEEGKGRGQPSIAEGNPKFCTLEGWLFLLGTREERAIDCIQTSVILCQLKRADLLERDSLHECTAVPVSCMVLNTTVLIQRSNIKLQTASSITHMENSLRYIQWLVQNGSIRRKTFYTCICEVKSLIRYYMRQPQSAWRPYDDSRMSSSMKGGTKGLQIPRKAGR